MSCSFPISKLPVELLEVIFITCVHNAEISPVVLTHVCKLWRGIAHGSARLWTDIDLISPERAKHFFALSQAAPLKVVWFNRSYGIVTTATRDWIWPHAGRFCQLDLVSPSKVIDHVVACLGDNLPVLSSWTLIAEDASEDLRIPIQLKLNAPRLRFLTLIHIKTRAEHLLHVIKSSPLLETIEIFQVAFTDVSSVDLNPLDHRPISPVRLLQLAVMSIGVIAQAYILTRLTLPAACSLLISEPLSALGWDAVLHPDVAAHLGSLSFTSLKLQPRFLELSRESHGGQCALTLNVVRVRPTDAFEFMQLKRFDTSHIRVVEIDNTADPLLWFHANAFFDSMPAIETLFLRKQASLELLVGACRPLRLREVRLVDVCLDNIAPWPHAVLVMGELVRFLRWRRREGIPLERLVLHNCRGHSTLIRALQSEVEVVVE